MRIISLVLITIISLYANIDNKVSNLAGNLSVSKGALNYNLALTLPAGTAGIKPDISLHYNSNGPNGYYGLGWSLSGLSAITRCGSNLEFDGIKLGVKYTNEDNICLDGQRLVAINGTNKWDINSEYRTQIQSYSKIIYDGSNFKVYTKNGDIKEYTLINQIWYLSSIKDRYNNTITYNYISTTSEVYIDTITYSDNTIKFNYENKLDIYNGYSGGHNIQITKRVDSIDIKNGSTILRTYDLTYKVQSSAIDKSIVESIKECSSGICLKPLVFTLESQDNGFETPIKWLEPSITGNNWKHLIKHQSSTGTHVHTDLIDMNGDGLPDRLYDRNPNNDADPGLHVMLNNGSGFEDPVKWLEPFSSGNDWKHLLRHQNSTGTHVYTDLIDINGDGLPDRLYYRNPNNDTDAGFHVMLNNGTGFDEPAKWLEVFPSGNDWKHLIKHQSFYATELYVDLRDMNGDGLVDRLYFDNPYTSEHGLFVMLNNGAGFEEPTKWLEPFSSGRDLNLLIKYQSFNGEQLYIDLKDMNGDGLPDRVYHKHPLTNAQGIYVMLNNGGGFDDPLKWLEPFSSGNEWKLLLRHQSSAGTHVYTDLKDINGDGLPDRLYDRNPNNDADPGLHVMLNNGSGFEDPVKWLEPFSSGNEWKHLLRHQNSTGTHVYTDLIDINGDGLPDRLYDRNPKNDADTNFYVMLNNGTSFDEPVKCLEAFPSGNDWKHLIKHQSFYATELYVDLRDMNGDGLVDRLYYNNPYTGEAGLFVMLNKGNGFNKITKITDSFGNETIINYKHLTDSSIYTKYNDAIYPNRDIQNSMQVVSSVVSKTPTGEDSNTSYSYEGLKTNLNGLGSLGFKKITSLNSLNNVKIETKYNQNYPFVGMVDKTTTYMDDTILSEVSNTYEGGSYGEITKIYQTKSISKNYQGTTLLSTVTTINNASDFDNFGNVLKTTTTTVDNTTGEEFKKTINNTYTNDSSSWILARLISASVKHEAYGDTKTKTSSFSYDETTGILKSEIIEPDSTKWLKKEYDYDSYGNRISETISGADIQTTTTNYTYDEDGKYIVKVRNDLGHEVSKTYDKEGRVKTITDVNDLSTSYDYDNFGKKTKEIRADGTYTDYEYSFAKNIINDSYYKIETKTLGFSDSTVYFNSLGNAVASSKIGFDGKTIYSTQNYDKFGNVVEKSLPYYTAETPQYTSTTFNRYNKVIQTDNLGSIDTFSYDKFITTHINSKNQIKESTKNVLGKVIKVVDAKGSSDEAILRYEYDALGALVKTINPSGEIITLAYDIYGNKVLQNDPDMGTWSYSYNALGQLKTQTDAKGQITSIEYDKLGRKISETLSDGSISTWQYDTTKLGKLHLEKKQSSSGTLLFQRQYSYDDLLRVNLVTTTIEDKTFTKSYSYDEFGRLKDKTLANNFILKNDYDDNGYLKAIKSPKEQIEDFDPSHFTQLITDLLNGSQLLHDEYLEYQAKAIDLMNISEYYRSLAEQNEEQRESLLAAAEQLEANALQYEAMANQSLTLSNQYLSQANDYLSRATLYYSMGNTSAGNYFTNLYNQYKSYSDQKAIESQDYLDQAQSSYNQLDSTNNQLRSIEFALRIADATLTLSQNTGNIANNLLQRSNTYTVDTDLQDAYSEMGGGVYNYFYKALAYNAKDQVVKHLTGNGLVNQTNFNDSGTIANISTGYDLDAGIRDLEFEYDKLNNLVRREDNKLQLVQDYEYDDLNRVTTSLSTTQFESYYVDYRYKLNGNISYKSDVGYYTYKPNTHQVIQAGSKTFTYDLNGNVLSNDNALFEYTPFNKTKKIRTQNSDIIEFKYDSNKQRYKKIETKVGSSNSTKTYYVDKSYEFKDILYGNDKEKYFIYANGKVISIYTRELSDNTLSNTKYLHYDSLNSVDTITNNIGEVKSRMSYSPFGKKIELDENGLKKENPSYTNRGYTGHEHIENTDYIHMNARIYDPDIGRFMSADTMIPYMYNSQSYNRYSYVRNNPLKYIDPSGHWGFNPAKIIKNVVKSHTNVLNKIQAEAERFETKHRQELKVAAVIALSSYTGLWAMNTFGNAIIAGAISGAAGGVAGVKINGGSWDDAFDAGLKGAVVGAVSAGVANEIANGTGELFNMGRDAGHSASFFSGDPMGAATFKAIAHGVSRAGIAKAQGHDTSSAFWSGFVASGFAASKDMGFFKGTMATAALSGTTSVITGGKFSNGAMTGAFVHMFNTMGNYFKESYPVAYDGNGAVAMKPQYGEVDPKAVGMFALKAGGAILSVAPAGKAGVVAYKFMMRNPNVVVNTTNFIQGYTTKTPANNPYQYAGRVTKIVEEYGGF